jgi:hypothetical protein
MTDPTEPTDANNATDAHDAHDPTDAPDPSELTLEELRGLRHDLQHDEDAVSYARRIAQARLDLVAAELERRSSGAGSTTSRDELRAVLSSHLTGGPARPPRPAEDLSDHALAVELDQICSLHGFGRLSSLEPDELAELADAIGAFEGAVSARRRALFDRLDALSAELVRRYRDGSADVASLHAAND